MFLVGSILFLGFTIIEYREMYNGPDPRNVAYHGQEEAHPAHHREHHLQETENSVAQQSHYGVPLRASSSAMPLGPAVSPDSSQQSSRQPGKIWIPMADKKVGPCGSEARATPPTQDEAVGPGSTVDSSFELCRSQNPGEARTVSAYQRGRATQGGTWQQSCGAARQCKPRAGMTETVV